jgi:hypothetical protein
VTHDNTMIALIDLPNLLSDKDDGDADRPVGEPVTA